MTGRLRRTDSEDASVYDPGRVPSTLGVRLDGSITLDQSCVAGLDMFLDGSVAIESRGRAEKKCHCRALFYKSDTFSKLLELFMGELTEKTNSGEVSNVARCTDGQNV